MPIHAIVLDCDGVILETVELKTRAFGRLVEGFGPEASRRLMDYHLENGGLSRRQKISWFFKEVLGRKAAIEELENFSQSYRRMVLDDVINAPYVPGSLEFIEEYSQTLPLFVASGIPEPELHHIFEARDIAKHFRAVRGTPPEKTEVLSKIVQEFGLNPQEVLMVGDSSTDLEAAEAVGTVFFGRGRRFAGSNWYWGDDLTGLRIFMQLFG